MFTKTELTHLAVLLGKAADVFGNHGCNDFPVPNTDENWHLCEQMEADNIGGSIEEWRKHRDYHPRPEAGDKIYLDDWRVMRFLAERARSQLEGE